MINNLKNKKKIEIRNYKIFKRFCIYKRLNLSS